MTPFAIAGVQMHISATESNVDNICNKIDLILYLYPWVQMVVCSELAPLGPILQNAQALPGPVEDAFRTVAARHGIWLLPGSIFQREGGKVYNTTPVIAPDGTVVARYRKMFPFLPYEEGVEPGTEFVVFDVPQAGRFGVSICYDMWFPETTRTLAAMGAEVILHPSLTSTIDRPIELALATASAAINQCFIFDINGVGAGGTGQSIVVGPAGDVLHQALASEEIIPLEIDLQRVRRSREVGLRGLGQPLKSFRDRRIDFGIYREPGGSEYLRSLGPLTKPQRGSRAGLDGAASPPPPPLPDAAGNVAVPESPYLAGVPGAELPAGVSLPIPSKGESR